MKADRKSPNEAASSAHWSSDDLYQARARSIAAIASGMVDRMRSRVSSASGASTPPGTIHDGMDPLAAEPLDDLLAEAADADAVAGQLRVRAGDADDVARATSASKPNSRSGDERWKKLSAFDWTIWARFITRRRSAPGGRRLDREDLVARLRRGDEVADRADAADARHDRGHLVDRAALDDALEAPELGDVELRVDHLAVGRRAGW